MKNIFTLKKLTILGCILILGLLLVACGTDDDPTPGEGEPTIDTDLPDANEVVATVNGEDILGNTYNLAYQDMFTNMMMQGFDLTDDEVLDQIHTSTMDRIIGNKLLEQDAKEKGYEVDPDEVHEQMELIRAQFEDDEEFYTQLEEVNMTLEELEDQVAIDIMVGKYMEDTIEIREITDEEIQEFYDLAFADMEDAPALEEVESTIRFTIEQQDIQDSFLARIDNLRNASEIVIHI